MKAIKNKTIISCSKKAFEVVYQPQGYKEYTEKKGQKEADNNDGA